MIALPLHLDGDGCWPDLAEKGFTEAVNLELALLTGGTKSGKPSVSIRVDLPDGSVVLAQTTLALFLNAADVFKARHGDPRR